MAPRADLPPPHAVPHTPERGRGRTRYPAYLSHQLDDAGKPRPLLHRRGTSHMYETLEDLLKEAGYKETRVFTPEVERREAERENGQKRDASGVGGAVAKMFSTWMSKKSVVDLTDDDTCPPSPLAHRQRPPLSTLATQRLQSSLRSSNISTPTLRPPSQLKSSAALQNQHLLTRQPSRPPSAFPSNPNSRARLALRHAASAPHMDKRRARTQPRAARPAKATAAAPPLPPTWLESLSAALSPRVSPPSSPASAHAPRKPAVLAHRTATSVAVTITNVVCRSAPSSRSCSAVRAPAKSRDKARLTVAVPTLAQTCVCEEQAATPWPPHSPHHLPPDAADASALPLDDDEDDELNLTMMLIPSKRQHSIRSLRSVLQHHGACPPAVSARARDEYARIMRRHVEESEGEDEAEAGGEGHWDSGEFLTAKIRRRRSNLPRQWGWAI
ncbi:hypothetical protein JB92DRAFT_3112405 [Gautieria morchelliformis]|nr:hypothetical protein JB92DRAFT_3112405 [Gautieria morchelliformis]